MKESIGMEVTSGGTTNTWTWNCNYYSSSSNQFSTSWRWDRVRHETSSNTPVTMRLRKGECEIKIIKAHSNVKLDRFLITSSSSYIPPAFLSVDVLKTDSRGMSGTKLTLGETIGTNRVRVGAFGTSILKTFEVTGVAGEPTRVVPANQNQTTDNWANQPLSKPFEVTLYDEYDNLVKGIPVHFDVTQGDGTLSVAIDTTDSNGKASTLLTLGFETIENIVQATFPGTLLEPVNFFGKADKGLAAEIQSLTSASGQKHYVGQQFNNFLKVKVINDQELPMVNVPVKFEALGIPATFGKVTKYTNAEGIAQDTLKLGSETGVLQVKASSVGVSRIVFIDSVYNRATKIVNSGGNNQRVGVGATTQIALKVRVYNGLEYASNHPVKFVAKNYGINGFRFPGATGNGDTLIVYTTTSGYAETKVIAGPKHGQYPDIIEAWATDGFYAVQYAPIKFTLTAISDASKLVYVGGNNQEAVVGSELPNPLQVQMLTIDNIPVVDQPVVFKITQGDGKFTTTDYTEFTDETDGEGIAEVFFNLGKKVGDENVNIVQATATNGEDELGGDCPVEFKLYAKSSNADSLAAVSPDTLKGTVGKALSQKIKVMAYGTLGEPAVGSKVKFSVVKGGGSVTTSGDTTTTITISKADGIAEVSWTLGSKTGVGNHRLQVSLLDDNGDHLKGSPHYFYASASPDVVDTLSSVVQATGPRQASGADSSVITVTLKDKYGNPISDKWVEITVTPKWECYINETIGPTDAQGQAKGYLVSTSAGEKVITAKVHDGVSLKKTATVVFLANNAAKISKVTSSTPAGNMGTVYRDSLVVRITDDQDNPVAYGPVLFRAVSDGASVVDTTGAFVKSFRNYSNAQGYASFYAVLNNAVGENVYEVSGTDINNDPLQGSPVTFSISGKTGTATSIFRVSQATVTGVAGKNIDSPLSVGVIDVSGDPVANVPVEFKVIEGNGKVQASGSVGTDAYGHAKAAFQADTEVGRQNLVTAASASLSGSPVLFTINSTPDIAYQLSYASDATQSGIVGGSTTQNLKVLVADRYGNPVSGYSVHYEIQSGNATIHNGSTASDTSDANGYVSMPLKLGTSTGAVKIKATGDYLLGAPLTFTVYAYTSEPANIIRYPASNSTIVGTKGKQLIDPLRVMVLDQYGNPVPNKTVLFAASDNNTGNGHVVESDPVVSDANGIASAHYVCSTTEGSEQASALLADKKVTFNIQSVTNTYSPTLNRIWESKTFVRDEGDQFLISVIANPDGDGDPITFEIANLFPPEGMSISVQAQNTTAMIEWTPTYKQQGTYVIYPRVTDGKGGADMDSLTLIVKNVNLDPMIVDWVPRIDTLMYSGQTVRFWVEAYDPDDDELHYAWTADNYPEGGDSPLLELSVDRFYSGVKPVKVIVSDGYTTTQFQWSPNFIPPTAISLAEFVASYDMWEQSIQLDWRTYEELENVGFYISRSTTEDGEYVRVNQNLILGNELKTYVFTDENIRAGTRYYYKLIDVDDHGFEFEHGPVMVNVPVPDKFELYQNFPNPFNPDTKIRYQLPHRMEVKLVLYNMMGQQVRTLVDEVKEAGFYTAIWDGRDSAGRQTSTGVYLYRFITPDQTITKKMLKIQ